MRLIFANPKDFEPESDRAGRRRSDEELMSLRQSVASGAYVASPTEIADAMLAEAWFEKVTRPRH